VTRVLSQNAEYLATLSHSYYYQQIWNCRRSGAQNGDRQHPMCICNWAVEDCIANLQCHFELRVGCTNVS